jgi:uncharacterized membrane protein
MHISWVLNSIGDLVCHQIPERSFQLGGQTLPLCARCTGVYAGFALGVFALVVSQSRNEKLLSLKAGKLTPITIFLVFGLQGVTERFGLWPSSNEIRLALGLLTGGAINLLLTPLTRHFLDPNTENVTKPGWTYWVIYLLLSSLVLVLVQSSEARRILGGVSIGGLGLIVIFLNAAVVSAVMRFRSRCYLAQDKRCIAVGVLSLFGAEWLALRFVL